MLLEAGVNPLEIQKRLGHSKLEVTLRYLHTTDETLRQTIEKLNFIYTV